MPAGFNHLGTAPSRPVRQPVMRAFDGESTFDDDFIDRGFVPGFVDRKKALEVTLQRRASLQRGEAGGHRDRVLRVERRQRGSVAGVEVPVPLLTGSRQLVRASRTRMVRRLAAGREQEADQQSMNGERFHGQILIGERGMVKDLGWR